MNTKLLRQKILDLAIRGKLTEQKKSDGTTKDLLKQIFSNVILSNAKNPGKSKNAPKEIIPLDKSEAPFEIPENWEWVRLGDVCEIKSSKRVFESDYVESGVPFYRSKEIGDLSRGEEIKTSLFIKKIHFDDLKEKYGVPQAGDVLITSVGTIGNTWICDGRDFYYKDGNITQIRKNLHIESKYIQLFLASPVFFKQALSTAAGTAQAALTIVKLNALLFPLPPLAEQQRIVTAIENAFAEITEIENNQELLKKHIKQGRQKILDLAIRGKLTEQKKSDGTTKDLLESIMAASSECHPERSAAKSKDLAKKKQTAEPKQIVPLDKTTAPFEIPESWEWVKINDIALDMADGPFGSNLKAEHYTDKKEARIIQLSNIAENGWRDENVRYTTFEHAKNNVFRSVVEPGNLVVAKMMPAGRTMICPSTEKMYVLSSDAVKLVPNDNLVDRQFLCLVMNSPSFRAQINDNIQGTTRLRTSISKLRDCMLALPPLAEQQRIVTTIEQSFAEFDAMEQRI